MAQKNNICFINSTTIGSTGTIVNDLARSTSEAGYNNLFLSHGPRRIDYVGSYVDILPHRFSYLFSRGPTFLFDGDGFRSTKSTSVAIKEINKFSPRIIHIHNAHGSFINIKKIIDCAEQKRIRIVWTLHDAWTITGRCGYPFSCDCWKSGCLICKYRNFYPRVIFSNSKKYFDVKHTLINSLIKAGCVFISPSEWLLNLFKDSYPNADARLIRNGIDVTIFCQNGKQNYDVLKFAHGRKVVGGTSLSEGKGGFYFERIAKRLDPKEYCVVVVGCHQNEVVSSNFLRLKSLKSREDMAGFYRSISVLLSPTQNDNFPTTHLESISCGTPVLTFNVGGASEMIKQGVNGYSVSLNDENALYTKLLLMLRETWNSGAVSSTQELVSDGMSQKYLELYDSLK